MLGIVNTVGELKDKLSNFPDEAPVAIRSGDDDQHDYESVHVASISTRVAQRNLSSVVTRNWHQPGDRTVILT